jgi:N-methylhydantoinase A
MSGFSARLAVDIGGTFTDLVLELGERIVSTKVLTTTHAPERGVLEGAKVVLQQAGIEPSDLELIIHGTTLATNALIERKGARTALITTQGFRDSLEIAYEHRFEQYDINMERPEPLVPRPRRYEVPERIAADGSVLLPMDEGAVERLADRMVTDGVEAVAICFLHSYQNAAHERRAQEIIARHIPERVIALSSEVCPEIREYERASTTVANAYVLPVIESYLQRLEQGFKAMGCRAPLLLIMSSGGITTVETARRFPVRLVESGPAGGAVMALTVAAQNGIDKALSFDMGGTTAKITLIDGLRPQQSRHFEIARAARFVKGSGIPVRIPVIDMVEIGAGGGSIARTDPLGRITVGPDSAGSEPGPASYGRGGTMPTVTDADLLLGWLDSARFAGGQIDLAPQAAERAVEESVASKVGLDRTAAAYGITELVTETMASAARVHAVENGKDMVGRTMIAFGGAAPLHAARLAQKLGIPRVVVPVGAGVGSAYGFLQAPMSYEVVRTRLVSLDDYRPDVVAALFAEMRREAEGVVRVGAPHAKLEEERVAYMRYRGQGHEVRVPVPEAALRASGGTELRHAFENVYRALYGRTIPRLEVEALSWTLSLAERRSLPAQVPAISATEAPSSCGHRTLVDPSTGSSVEARVHARTHLPAGATVQGPAIITEAETSTLVPAGFTATLNGAGQVVIERSST